MIANFFSKTKPIHFVIITLVLFFAFLMTVLFGTKSEG